jgi:hypothetical protein
MPELYTEKPVKQRGFKTDICLKPTISFRLNHGEALIKKPAEDVRLHKRGLFLGTTGELFYVGFTVVVIFSWEYSGLFSNGSTRHGPIFLKGPEQHVTYTVFAGVSHESFFLNHLPEVMPSSYTTVE